MSRTTFDANEKELNSAKLRALTEFRIEVHCMYLLVPLFPGISSLLPTLRPLSVPYPRNSELSLFVFGVEGLNYEIEHFSNSDF